MAFFFFFFGESIIMAFEIGKLNHTPDTKHRSHDKISSPVHPDLEDATKPLCAHFTL